jgi:SNF2 family DNA or RNA helicase
MHFTPRNWQHPMIQFMLDHQRGNLFAGMGLGKTSSSLYAFKALRMFGEARRALVLAPKRVAFGTWPNEIPKWQESFGDMSIAAAIGTQEQRINALYRKADITTINYDNLEWLIDTVGEHWPWDTVFADESTRLKGLRTVTMTSKKGNEFTKGQGSVRAKALSKVAHRKVRRWYNLTGSPAPNGLQDLWGQMWFVDGGQRLGSSFSAFSERYFRSVPNADGYSQLRPLASSDKLIQDKIRDVSLTVDIRDWLDISEPIESIVPIELPSKARRIYDQMEREFFAMIAENPVEVFGSGGKLQKLMQIANGAVFVNEQREWEEVHNEKIEALRSVCEEANGEPVLVRYTHIPDLKRILKAFPRAKFLDNNPQTESDWNKGKIPMLVAHAASAGHGLNLQDGGRILCDFSTDFNLEQDEQIIERIGPTRQLQSGHNRAVYRYRLVAMDTIEQHSALPAVRYKMNVQDALKESLKIRGFSTPNA